MANPQKENGYTAIANEIYDAMIAFRVSGECEQVLKVVIRKTYGFNKKEDYISNSQFMEMTKLKKQNVSRAIIKLINHKLVIKTDYSKKLGGKYLFNKDFEQWIPLVIKTDYSKKSSKLITNVIKTDDQVSSKLMSTKDNQKTIKDNTEILSTKVSGSKKKKEPKIPEPWEMEDKRKWRDETLAKGRYGKLLMDYFIIKEMKFPTRLSANQAFKRFLKVSKEITEAYPDDFLILKGLKKLKADHKQEMWTLETLLKILPTM